MAPVFLCLQMTVKNKERVISMGAMFDLSGSDPYLLPAEIGKQTAVSIYA